MTLSPQDVLIRLAQQYAGSGPVLCRWCCAPWGHHAAGCPVQGSVRALDGGAGATGTVMPTDDETHPRAAVGCEEGV